MNAHTELNMAYNVLVHMPNLNVCLPPRSFPTTS